MQAPAGPPDNPVSRQGRYIGVSLAPLCGDTLGILSGTVSLCLMSFGLEAVYTAELGSALSTIITGIFLLVFNIIAEQGQAFRQIAALLFVRHGQADAPD